MEEPYIQAGQTGVHYNNLAWNLEKAANETKEVLKRVLPDVVAKHLKQDLHIDDT